MRDERDERYARELSDRIDAHIAGFSPARKLGYSGLACLPVACALYGTSKLLHSCPGDEDVKYAVGLMMSGGIFSLFSLVWFLLLFPSIKNANHRLTRTHPYLYLVLFITIVIILRSIFLPIGRAIDQAEAARCGLRKPHAALGQAAPILPDAAGTRQQSAAAHQF